ncbi:Planctomycete cytochrome C [Cyclobacterium lianum]|uniref:Planctomycete cytochrome C n=2 Tax=Cyclobacterium lianum TaxID=388280 RepID=A0A1M7QN25_9BACT|nr:Planctomycete cytochrome C [Cyclobacterium lianum]
MLTQKKIMVCAFSGVLLLALLIWILRIVPLENKHRVIPAILLGEAVDYNQDIRPIVNNKCIACHGGVKKSGGFSLLFEEEALAVNESGERAIVPGNTRKSELLRRIKHHDPEFRMPLESDPLSGEEIELFTRWINQGAKWDDHWAYKPPKQQEIPDIQSPWIINEIDRFVLDKMGQKGLQPNPLSDRYSLIRRLSFDLTGLPPELEKVQEFLSDTSENAYEKLVDHYLASPAYGERWAAMWMDLARYADSKGYEADRPRNIWKYRDWLIHAFNDNMPFDRFVTEQLAGDLMPDPTDEQYIATAFHRNTMNNDEGGTDNEEFRTAAILDRVNTTWTILQGTTMECVQCHSHPYDPIRHEDYYRSLAFFNQTADADIPSEAPVLINFESEEDIERLTKIQSWVSDSMAAEQGPGEQYFTDLIRLGEPKLHPHYFEQIDKGIPIKGTATFKVDPLIPSRTRALPFAGEDRLMFKVRASDSGGNISFRLDSINGREVGNWEVRSKTKTRFNEETKKDESYAIMEVLSIPITPTEGKHDLYLVYEGSEEEITCTFEWVLLHHSLPGNEKPGYKEVERTFYELYNTEADKETTPVMVSLPERYQRETRLFERGSWMVPGDRVSAGVPEIWNAFDDQYPADRLGFSRWLFSPANPLTARVMVNRLWEQLFGRGLVPSLEDFGSQGSAPTHPELLDWLALRFMEDMNWDIKRLLKELVMSASYRQSSHFREELVQIDPLNEWLARGPRLRLTAEQIRDQALAVSGLLSEKMYGPSVMPDQPEGIWQVVYSGEKWQTSKGEDKYRRAMYTFWRRTSPYPSIIAFDAPSREFCLPERIPTNTPLQALVTLNDPVYLEASLALARRVLKETSWNEEQRLSLMYSLAVRRGVSQEKLADLKSLYEQTKIYFENQPQAVCQLIGEEDESLATYTVVANAVMNLDEFLMKS